jgi:hypothetical protein
MLIAVNFDTNGFPRSSVVAFCPWPAGALLRKPGVNGLVFPSARNDPFLRVKDVALGVGI